MYYLFSAFLISLTIQIGGFAYGYLRQSDHLTDLLYGLTFLILGWWSVWIHDNFTLPALILLILITLWSLRLSLFLFVRIRSMKRDRRFDEFRQSFWKLLGFWLLQGVSVWIILLPSLIFITHKNAPLTSLLDYLITGIGGIIFLLGLTLEAIADHQKFRFKQNPENKGKWIQSGLWSRSRHPNYLGEILVWTGAFIFCLPALGSWEYLSVISPVYITWLLTKISGIPILEKKADERWGHDPEYQKYKKETPVLGIRL